MNRRYRIKINRILYFFLVVSFLLAGCAGSAAVSEPTATPTKDPGPEQTAAAKAEEETNAQASQTASALAAEQTSASETAAALATQDAQATAEAAASTAQAQKTLDAQATQTQKAADKATMTAEAALAATAQAQPLYEIAQLLFANGALTSTEGEFIAASDFDESWAQMNYYQFHPVPEALLMETDSFIVRADLSWSSASDNANWDSSGCGFIVVDPESGRHHMVNLSMSGYANLYYNDGSGTAYLRVRRTTSAKGIPEGQAEFVLAVQDDVISVYVNGEEAFSFRDPKYMPGMLTYTLISGTNKGYGTRCEMTNVGLWDLE